MRRNTWTYLAFLLLGVIALIVVLNMSFPGQISEPRDQLSVLYALMLLALVGSSVAVGWRHSAGLALKQGLAWVAVFIGVLIIYSYRAEFAVLADRVSGEVLTSRPTNEAPGVVSLRADARGHFSASTLVEGTHVNFMVDTGASFVSLSNLDAQRVGIDVDELDYNIPMQTANGRTYTASVKISELSIGDIVMYDVPAIVSQEGRQGESLLGMSFLSRLSRFEVDQDRLVLYQ